MSPATHGHRAQRPIRRNGRSVPNDVHDDSRMWLTILAFHAAVAMVGCGTDAHGLGRFHGEEREAGEAVVEYYEAFASGDEKAFCDRVYAHERGSDPWIPPANSDCYQQTLEADDTAADVVVENVVLNGWTGRAEVTIPHAANRGSTVSIELRRFGDDWRVRFIPG